MLERGKQISLLRDYVFFCHELEKPDLFFFLALRLIFI